MHDTFLNQNLYESMIDLCRENSIAKILNLTITVHTNSHISENSIREQFSERKNELIGDWTNILVRKGEIEPLTAIIDSIDGEKFQ
jgi:Zn finger protein HypA/HybF involved in hydrogenase expression